jgi:hypothetical protein
VEDVEALRPEEAATHVLVSHLALRDGDWPVLGRGAFDPSAWPVAELERRVDDRLYAIRWDEQTLSEEVAARRLHPEEAGRRPPDGLLGTDAAVVTLRRLFAV